MSIVPMPPKPSLPILIEVVKRFVDGAKKVWNALRGKDKKQDEIAQQKGVNIAKSKADEISDLNQLLMEYRANISDAADSLEHDMIMECVDMIDSIMEDLKEHNEKLKVVRIERSKRRFSNVNRELKGTFSEYIKKRISLDDSECLAALKLPAGELKNKRLQELKEKAFIEASNEILDRVKKTVDDFIYDIEDAFYEHLERSEEKLAEKTAAFEKLSDMGDHGSQEEILLNSGYIIAMCKIAEDELTEEIG